MQQGRMMMLMSLGVHEKQQLLQLPEQVETQVSQVRQQELFHLPLLSPLLPLYFSSLSRQIRRLCYRLHRLIPGQGYSKQA